jgi:cell wall-associated NlpC family hydrolase
MPIAQTASVLVAATALLIATAAPAQEVDKQDGTATSSSVRNMFTSWFGAGKSRTDAADADAEEADMPPPVEQPTFTARAGSLVADALGLLGISYRMGGSTPQSGFDCSGLVRYVFQSAIGLNLPRRAEEISRIGAKVDRQELKPGDLVFYKTLRKTFSHVGIYLGNNRFIHAPSAGGAVRIDDMTQSYWAARFNGARRVEN